MLSHPESLGTPNAGCWFHQHLGHTTCNCRVIGSLRTFDRKRKFDEIFQELQKDLTDAKHSYEIRHSYPVERQSDPPSSMLSPSTGQSSGQSSNQLREAEPFGPKASDAAGKPFDIPRILKYPTSTTSATSASRVTDKHGGTKSISGASAANTGSSSKQARDSKTTPFNNQKRDSNKHQKKHSSSSRPQSNTVEEQEEMMTEDLASKIQEKYNFNKSSYDEYSCYILFRQQTISPSDLSTWDFTPNSTFPTPYNVISIKPLIADMGIEEVVT